MRKTILIVILSFLCLGQLMSQSIVSMQPETRKLVLEEFGGIYCTYCPDGNEITTAILSEYPEDVFAINIHEGSWAEPEIGAPDFRTIYGDGFILESGLNAFPAGMVNRLNFSGLEQDDVSGILAMSRWNWEEAIEGALDMPSIVNVAATATIDYASNEMEVYVEIYYTGDSEASTNYLNIAVLQNNIHGPQSGGNQGGNYLHQHILRDMITGQWGVPITTTASGHFESRSFTYPLPADINGVLLDLPNIELVVFVNENHQNTLNAIHVKPSYYVENSTDANALFLQIPDAICGNEIEPFFTLRNDGNHILSEVLIEYKINQGLVHTYEWTGVLSTFESEIIALPSLPIDDLQQTNNCLSVHISPLTGEADENNANDSLCRPFLLPPSTETPTVVFELKTDEFGYDIYWEITDEFDNIVASGGNEIVAETEGGAQIASEEDPGAYPNNENISVEVALPAQECYTFRILDDFGDGLCCEYGVGFFYLTDENNNLIFSGGNFLTEKIIPFTLDNPAVTVVEEIIQPTVKLYPNPISSGNLFYEFNTLKSETLKIELFNSDTRIQYQTMEIKPTAGIHKGNIDVHVLPTGVYYLKFTTAKGSMIKKFVITH